MIRRRKTACWSVMTRTRELQVAHIPWNVAHSGPFGKKKIILPPFFNTPRRHRQGGENPGPIGGPSRLPRRSRLHCCLDPLPCAIASSPAAAARAASTFSRARAWLQPHAPLIWCHLMTHSSLRFRCLEVAVDENGTRTGPAAVTAEAGHGNPLRSGGLQASPGILPVGDWLL
jgi:hypothetical protein